MQLKQVLSPLEIIYERSWDETGLPLTKLVQGGEVVEITFEARVIVGIFEVHAGLFSFSVALVPDGVQCFAEAVVSLIIWVGLPFRIRRLTANFILAAIELKLSAV